MNLHPVVQIFLSYLGLEREKAATRRLEQVVKAENLDDFLAVENSKLGLIEYSTNHGFRLLYRDCFQHCPLGNRPELRAYLQTLKGH